MEDRLLSGLLWQPLVTKTNSNISNKSFNRISSGNHKRTQQGVSAELLPYLYQLHIVHATNNYSCPNVHMLSISIPYILLRSQEVDLVFFYFLFSF